ncbi:M50 family metallopeptidase [Solihabitans fulvus]|uniref:M50 family metallopeptidase n=1 Tax=Solihabitans fulvus TaxID=1892852 RepID=A0A5B2WR34_9PSEU|nr:M50 family metallopeptidase [Solihabitans fulvus]KAA2254463.1 M50 family metallopeptidase [Solihabitans fulvus]
MSIITQLWDSLSSLVRDTPRAVVVGAGLVALLVVLSRGPWRLARNAITIAHEGGHALVALLTGRRLAGVKLHSDTSGVTVSAGRSHGPGMVFTALAGYVTPSLLGLGAAALVSAGHVRVLLWISIALLLAMLVMIRNVFGVVSVVVTGGALFAVSWFTTYEVQAAFANLVCWFLLFGGVRPISELQRKRRRGRARDSDADQLARLTRVSGTAWVALFALVAVASLVLGGRLLLTSA